MLQRVAVSVVVLQMELAPKSGIFRGRFPTKMSQKRPTYKKRDVQKRQNSTPGERERTKKAVLLHHYMIYRLMMCDCGNLHSLCQLYLQHCRYYTALQHTATHLKIAPRRVNTICNAPECQQFWDPRIFRHRLVNASAFFLL